MLQSPCHLTLRLLAIALFAHSTWMLSHPSPCPSSSISQCQPCDAPQSPTAVVTIFMRTLPKHKTQNVQASQCPNRDWLTGNCRQQPVHQLLVHPESASSRCHPLKPRFQFLCLGAFQSSANRPKPHITARDLIRRHQGLLQSPPAGRHTLLHQPL